MYIPLNHNPHEKVTEYRRKLRAWERAAKALYAAQVAVAKAEEIENNGNNGKVKMVVPF